MTKEIPVYPPHPFAAIFPICGDTSLIELSDSIAEHGQKEEIVLYEKQILDGRRRQAAAIRAGKEPKYRQWGSRPLDGNDPLEFAFIVNYARRNMSESERTLAAREYANLKRGRNPTNPTKVGLGETPVSQKEAAAKFDVNVKQIERANKVMEHGVPELQQAMKAETVSITDAASIATEPPHVQKAAVAAVEAGTAPTLAAAVAATKPAPEEDRDKCCKDLEAVAERVSRIPTSHAAALKLAHAGLLTALGLLRKLPA